jgi:hypothetical protein
MKLGKRGMTKSQYYAIGEFLAAGIVFLTLFTYLKGVATDSQFEQNFMARDVALLLDSIHAAPGDVSFAYDASIKENSFVFEFSKQQKLRFAFDNSQVLVFPSTVFGVVIQPARYPFGRDSNLELIFEDPFNAEKLGGYGSYYGQPTNTTFVFIKKTDDALNISTSQEVIEVRNE